MAIKEEPVDLLLTHQFIKKECLPFSISTDQSNNHPKVKAPITEEFMSGHQGLLKSKPLSNIKCENFECSSLDGLTTLPEITMNLNYKTFSKVEIKSEILEVDDVRNFENKHLHIENSDLVKIKSEMDNSIALKSELLSEECDIPIVKSEIEFSEQSSSSKKLQQSIPNRLTLKIVKIKRKYLCPVCCKNYVSTNSRNKHLCQHFGKHNVICFMCGKIFNQQQDFKHHLYIHFSKRCLSIKKNVNTYFKCNICYNLFVHKLNLKKHYIQHIRTDDSYVSQFIQNRDLDLQTKIHIGKRPCNYESLRKITQKKSLPKFMKKTQLKCDLNINQFVQVDQLKEHIETDSSTKPFKCELCLKQFSRNTYLLQHIIRFHTGEKLFKCEICLRKFTQNFHLTEHKKIHEVKKPFKCEICSKQYGHKGHLNEHLRIHSGEKPYRCKLCLRQFSRSSYLLQHMRVHTGEKLFKCEFCLMQFINKNVLIRHMKIHTGEKPYNCEICLKQFPKSGNLTQHMKIHTGEKYKCEFCSKQFTHKGHLNEHIRMHTGEKPFKCELCLKRFSRNSNFIQHWKRHT